MLQISNKISETVSLVSENSTKEVSTHVLLDTCSQGTFVLKGIVNMLGIVGTPTSITFKTLNCDVTDSSLKINGLKVCATLASGMNKQRKLPKSISQNKFQVDVGDIETWNNR